MCRKWIRSVNSLSYTRYRSCKDDCKEGTYYHKERFQERILQIWIWVNYRFNLFRSKNKKTTKASADEDIEKDTKKQTIFDEILEKPAVAPKTSRNAKRKSFKFFEEEKQG